MDHSERHKKLSDLNDDTENVYDMTKDIAAVAKQIKANTKEDTDPPNPVLESINRFHANS